MCRDDVHWTTCPTRDDVWNDENWAVPKLGPFHRITFSRFIRMTDYQQNY